MSSDNLNIHPTSIVSPEARVGEGVKIGAYAIVGPDTIIGDHCEIGPHVVIDSGTELGQQVRIFQFASVGAPPQDLKYGGEPTRLQIGDGTIIRESCTIHRGTVDGGGLTTIGKNCLLMAYCHVAHDCHVGDHVIMANGATLGGHVTVEEYVVMGGLCAVQQFCRVGAYAFIGGMSGANKDIPPFVRFWGQRGKVYGLNLVGLKRHGFSKEAVTALRDAYRIIFKGPTLEEALPKIESRYAHVPEVKRFLQFIKDSERGIALFHENGNIKD